MTEFKTIRFLSIIGCLLAGILASCESRQATQDIWKFSLQKMSGFPIEEDGFSLGVSACYAGTLGDQLIMAGGCNFPEIPAAEGGKKKFYKGIYAADCTGDSVFVWRKVGELPVAAAYGATISIADGLVLVGGMSADGALSSVFHLSLSEDKQRVILDTLRSLPFTMDNMAGTTVNHTLFLMGGNVNGQPSKSLYSFLYTKPDSPWVQEAPFPGEARIQPVCVGQPKDGSLYVWGGFAPAVNGRAATLSTDGYRYSVEKRTWEEIGVPVGDDFIPVSLGGGIAYSMNDSLIVCTGGVNKEVFLSALRREERLKEAIASSDSLQVDSLKAVVKESMTRPSEWYRFNDKILVYHTLKNVWTEMGRCTAMARAGAAMVGGDWGFYSISGELKPGIRTPEINKIIINTNR